MPEDVTRERAINLFKFLRELTLLRSHTTRSLEKYEKVIWFNGVPTLEGCFNVFRTNEDERSELWLEVEQPRVPAPPTIPETCLGWTDEKQFFDPTLGFPALVKKLVIQFPVGDPDEPSTEGSDKASDQLSLFDASTSASDDDAMSTETTEVVAAQVIPQPYVKKKGKPFGRKLYKTEIRNLEDYPVVEEDWSKYVADKWLPWAETAKPFAPIQKLYDELFEIHHTLQTVAENYEFSLAVGCLSWKTPNNQKVFRHLLTVPASLEFDASRGVISVMAPLDGARYKIELDMLEMGERPPQQQRKEIDQQLASLTDDFWNAKKLTTLLESFAHTISSHGTFDETLEYPTAFTNEPLVHLAPAIILRQRSDLQFVQLFDEIVKQISDGQELPLGVERLVNIVDDQQNVSSINHEDLTDDEIYFPLPANQDQCEIAARLKDRQGILVQGPPGTGKSHTISNLVCHLLAMGKRILVTSHTPRALTVLREKFPEDMQALCVSVVGDDTSDARKALEDSVAGITAKHNSWNSAASKNLIGDLQKQLSDSRQEQQWILQSLRSIKEKDTFAHTQRFKNYSGTTLAIAKKLQDQTNAFEWFSAKVDDDQPPLNNSDTSKVLELIRAFDFETAERAGKSICKLDKLPSPTAMTELAAKTRNASEMSAAVEASKAHICYQASTKLLQEDRERLVHRLDELITLFHRVLKRPEEFAAVAAKDIIGDHDRKWRELHELTQKHLAGIDKNFREIASKTVSGLGSRDMHTVRVEATALRDHFYRGGKIGLGPFKSKAVKDGAYFIKEVRIDGKPCNGLAPMDELVDYVNLEIAVALIRKLWLGICETIPSSIIGAVATFHDICEPLHDGLTLHEKMVKLRQDLSNFPSLIAPHWNEIESIRSFRDVINAGAAEQELILCKNQHSAIETEIRTYTTDPNVHPALVELQEAITLLDDQKYHGAYESVKQVIADQSALAHRDELLGILKLKCPAFFNSVKETAKDEVWDSRCATFEEAWHWNKASQWIIELSDPATFKKYNADLEKVAADIRDTLKQLAAVKAWEHTFKRLSEEQRQHLISWSMAVRRIGKGTGKHAEKHRRDARMHMDKCRSSIPAWIMPIHKVVETIRPGTDMFDVIIVDEASQSGPEALFLLYIGKQLVVVGDDKQISPDTVGLDRSSVDALRAEFLKDIPHSDAIGLEHSFFDQAKIRYRGQVRLREHFRCMPEIIQFSNNLCYSSDPLIPLRQYGGGRITPVVKSVMVPGGYTNEISSKPVNIPEAQAILDEVKRICADPMYAGKSIGIISLLNTSGQAKYLDEHLRNSEKYISKDEYTTRNMRVGDAYVFQGDERDIILLSMVSAPPEKGRLYPLTSEKDERRFNVAVSRARDQLILFHSVELGDLNPKCIRQRLLSYCLNPNVESTGLGDFDLSALKDQLTEGYLIQSLPPKPFDSWFELDVFIRVSERGYRVLPQVNMNGYRIDLIVEGLRGRLAVECDGDRWHGAEQYDADMARQRDLERCGLQFWRVRGSAFYFNPEKALEDLWKTLTAAEIFPTADHLDRQAKLLETILSTGV